MPGKPARSRHSRPLGDLEPLEGNNARDEFVGGDGDDTLVG